MRTAYKALGFFMAFAVALAAGPTSAQSYPARPIKLVVGFGPGGGTDILGRLVAQKLAERLGVAVTVENRPGANSNIGTDYVAKSAPDGYTLLVGGSASMALSPGLYQNLPFDAVKDFAPIAQIVTGDTLVIAVNPSLPIKTIKELVAHAKANPGKVFYSSGAAPFQVAAEFFNRTAGIKMTHVPFKGSAGALTATVAGETQAVVVSVAAAKGQLKSGKIRALAIIGFKPDPAYPDVPTLKQAGLESFEVPFWTGLFAPAATPAPIIDRLYKEMAVILKSDFIKERFASMGYEAGDVTPAEFRKLQARDVEQWTKIIRQDLGIKGE